MDAKITTKAKHTPAPWLVENWRAIEDTDDWAIARLDKLCIIAEEAPDGVAQDYEEQDACLIAAAPDLLAACEVALDILETIDADNDVGAYLYMALGGPTTIKIAEAIQHLRAAKEMAENNVS